MAWSTDEIEWDLNWSNDLIQARDREQNGWSFFDPGKTHTLTLSVTSRNRAAIKQLYEGIEAILRQREMI